jgi:hypothetical protein
MIDQLPDGILIELLRLLPLGSALALSCTCRRCWAAIASALSASTPVSALHASTARDCTAAAKVAGRGHATALFDTYEHVQPLLLLQAHSVWPASSGGMAAHEQEKPAAGAFCLVPAAVRQPYLTLTCGGWRDELYATMADTAAAAPMQRQQQQPPARPPQVTARPPQVYAVVGSSNCD